MKKIFFGKAQSTRCFCRRCILFWQNAVTLCDRIVLHTLGDVTHSGTFCTVATSAGVATY